jgi:hypothetical protein
MITLVVATAVVAGLAGIVFFAQNRATSRDSANRSQTTVNASPSRAAADIETAAAATCQADYAAVSAAVSYYQTLNGTPPSSMDGIRAFLKDSVASSRFAITIDPTHPGVIEVAAGGHPPKPGDGNCVYAG